MAGSSHCGPSGSGKTNLWQQLKAALQKMGNSITLYTMNPKAMPRTQVVLTSCDHKYPYACFCVDFNLVWQIISVSSSLFVTTTVALFLTLLYNNISTVYVLHVRTATFYWVFILCFIVVSALPSVYAHQMCMRMYVCS